jgi:serine protease Do
MGKRSGAGAVLTVVVLVCLAVFATATAQTKIVVKTGDHAGDIYISDEGEGTGHGWLGVSIAQVEKTKDTGEKIEGVLITDVYDDSPAEAAGLEDGDIIIEFEGKKTHDIDKLVQAVRDNEPGSKVKITVMRDGEKKTFTAELAERKEKKVTWNVGRGVYLDSLEGLEGLKALAVLEDLEGLEGLAALGAWDIGVSGWGGRGRLGVYVDDLSEGLAEYFNVPDGKGVLVEDVVEDSPAEAAGIKAGDVILKIGDERVSDTGELVEAIAEMEADVATPIIVLREGREHTLDATVGETSEKIHVMKLDDALHKYQIALDEFEAGEVGEFYGQKLSKDEMEDLKDELEDIREELKELRDELAKMKD